MGEGAAPHAQGGNNGSAFFSRLPLRTKSAMAEILVLEVCAPRLSAGGVYFLGVSICPGAAPARARFSDWVHRFSVLRVVFSIVFHCSCAGGLSLAVSRPCPLIGAYFPL